MKQYIHTIIRASLESDQHLYLDNEVVLERLLNYKGKRLLVIGCIRSSGNKNSSYIIIPGFVRNYRRWDEKLHSPVSDIEEEVPKELYEDATKFVKEEGLEGVVNFWQYF